MLASLRESERTPEWSPVAELGWLPGLDGLGYATRYDRTEHQVRLGEFQTHSAQGHRIRLLKNDSFGTLVGAANPGH